ncbi:hypothetical protein CAL7716_085110 [Calothrix sp. PCC 7716]|nr:hypothetical protein CAL7716_085110 [Calothrix sp. PCC 7716]
MAQTTFDAQVLVQEVEQNSHKVTQELPVTCASCPYFQAHNDGTNKGWCGLFDHFARATHEQTQDCINTIRDEQAETEDEVDEQLIALTNELPAGYEIDAAYDAVFGKLYRLWQSFHLCGTFYRDEEGYWIPQPSNCSFRPRVETELHAQMIIIKIYEDPCLQVE